MKATLFLILVSGLLVTSPPVSAHHSFAAEFDVDSPVELRGVLTKMEWVNPHGWLYIDVTQPDGTVVNWAIEAGGPNQLLRRGLRKTDFPIGLEVLVQGFAAKSGAAKANGQEITTADGRNFFLGVDNSGGGATAPWVDLTDADVASSQDAEERVRRPHVLTSSTVVDVFRT